MKIKHTYETLFRVSVTGLELVGDFVTRMEAEDYAIATEMDSYCVITTTVIETREVKTTSQTPRTITKRGEAGSADEKGGGLSADDGATEREKGPIKNSRNK